MLLLIVQQRQLHVVAQEDMDTAAHEAVSNPKTKPRQSSFSKPPISINTKPAFNAQYSGPNSLKTAEDKENSITATLYLGIKLWKGAELYINPEIAGGSGLSGAFGLAASTNGGNIPRRRSCPYPVSCTGLPVTNDLIR